MRRQGRRQRVPSVPAAPGPDRAGSRRDHRRRRTQTPAATQTTVVTTTHAGPARGPDIDAEMLAYYEARAPEYDDWYLRRGRYERGPIHDAAWNAELDLAGRWLDGLPIGGEIVELAAGTGWWSPLLAVKGELSLYDGNAGPARARPRASRGAPTPGAPPRPRRVGRTRPPGRCRLHRLLAQPCPARPARCVPGARPSLAQAGRGLRLHRFAARSAVECGRSPDPGRRPVCPQARRRTRVHGRQGLLRARRDGSGADAGRFHGRRA